MQLIEFNRSIDAVLDRFTFQRAMGERDLFICNELQDFSKEMKACFEDVFDVEENELNVDISETGGGLWSQNIVGTIQRHLALEIFYQYCVNEELYKEF